MKFYKSSDMCDVQVSLGDWDTSYDADNLTLFDTLDECCANVFWYDMDGCLSRSSIAFQFEFCVDISNFRVLHSPCPLEEIYAIESAMRKGLGNSSDIALVRFGSTELTKLGGEIKCIDPTLHQDSMENQPRRLVIGRHESKLNICGVVVTKEPICKEETCLRDAFEKIVVPFEDHFYNGAFSSALYSSSGHNFPHLLDLQAFEQVVVSSFRTRDLFAPSTATIPISKHEATSSEYSTRSSDAPPRFYPTYIPGQLCHLKTMFDSWEESYGTLNECCEVFFRWDIEACCSSLNMGGC